jgi:hypothetical protein
MLFFATLLIPALFWDKGPETADQLKQAGITRIAVPAAMETPWKSAPGITVRLSDKESRVKLGPPKVEYRVNQAGPTRSPWVDSNGWRIVRSPEAKFVYDAPGPGAALAAAEAYAFGADALIGTDAAGLAPLGEMLTFLSKLKSVDLPPVANIGFVDDGSPEAGEAMNLMIRRNLLFRRVAKPDRRLPLNVELGSGKYPKSAAANPSEFAQQVRFELTDEKRSLRVYGSEVVIGRLSSDGKQARVHLLNYASAARPVRGVRVRVLGRFPKHELNVFGVAGATLADYTVLPDATEFTIIELKSLATIDLSR